MCYSVNSFDPQEHFWKVQRLNVEPPNKFCLLVIICTAQGSIKHDFQATGDMRWPAYIELPWLLVSGDIQI